VKKHLLRQKMIGSLETDTSGLLVFTQNWGVTRHLENANKPLEEEYVAKVSGHLGEGGLEKLKRGLKLPDRQLPPCKVSWQNETHLRFALKAPQPGQIRQMCAAVGLKLLGLRRIRIGAVSMAKLPAGQWRYLLPNERF
jgi:23S rRNA pseudouridine2604 synthase